MTRDIDVDQQELEKFIETLQEFQDTTSERLKAVISAWSRCDESWKGNRKQAFAKEFEETNNSVHHALEETEDALQFLERFNETVKEFEEMF